MDFKRYLLIGATSAILFGAGCASSPEEPTDSNSPPRVDSVAESSGRRVIGAGGNAVVLRAETTDVDGDPLEFTWTGPGTFGPPNHTAKTVTWTPPSTIGTVTIVCSVSDPSGASASRSANFRLVRQITNSDYGDVVGNQLIWTGAAGEDYLLKGEVTVPEGIELVIAGGADVYCDEDSKITARGGFTVSGSRAAVRFLANAQSASAGFWQGIYFESSLMPLAVQGLTLFDATTGLNLSQGVPMGATIVDCVIDGCNTGIDGFNTMISISGSDFNDCDRSLILSACTIESLTGCNFTGNQIETIRIEGIASNGSIDNNSFSADATVFIETVAAASVSFHGNSFFGTGDVFRLLGSGTVDMTCNNWGPGASEATIPTRIVFNTGGVTFIPYLPGGDPGGECGP